MIKNIVFDIGDVLIEFHWKKTMQEHGFSEAVISAFEKDIVMSEDWNQLDLGVLPEQEIFEHFKEKIPAYAEELDRFLEFREEIVTPFPGTRAWLTDLKKRGYHIYLLSNYPKSFFELHASKRFDFMDLVDGAVVSYEVQSIKPDKKIYEHLFKRYNIKPEESVFLDDRPMNVQAARQLHMQAIHYKEHKQAVEELDDLLAICFTKEGQSCIYKSHVMSLWKDRLQFPDGDIVEYDLVKQKGGACVLPVDEDGNVYLVKQYRNTLNRVNLEVPAGCYDTPDEAPLACAKRELSEELGISAGTWTYFTEIITDIGISDERVAVFFASDLMMGACRLDREEFIRLVKLPYSQALQMVYEGEIVDAKTVVALLGYKNFFDKLKE
ncbi:MAG: HAD-IA family hydrolase [Lachnospiraceae bacterium]|nr:HAD-IA family hydrolase [Lachnospiraceae bacterium]